MIKRIITGAAIVAITVVFFLLRYFVNFRVFELFVWAICGIATYEVARAVMEHTSFKSFLTNVVFGAVGVPIYFMFESSFGSGYGALAFLVFLALIVVTNVIFWYTEGKKTSLIAEILPVLYPSLLVIPILLLNGSNRGYRGFVLLIDLFVIPACSDTAAYFIGSKIGGKKLCPKISPKKTVSGAVGGTLGGIIGSILVCVIFRPYTDAIFPILLFTLIGFVGSILTVFGDLFESYIKRRVGIKDMGNILPGHGGVSDRIDGLLFLAPFIFLVSLIL